MRWPKLEYQVDFRRRIESLAVGEETRVPKSRYYKGLAKIPGQKHRVRQGKLAFYIERIE